MAITPEKLQTQVERLRALAGHTQDWDIVAGRLSEELWRQSEDDAHVERIVDGCVSAKFCPAVGDVAILAAATASPVAAEIHGPDPGCLNCDGTGWQTVTRGEYSGVRECPCDTRRIAAVAQARLEAEEQEKREADLKAKRERKKLTSRQTEAPLFAELETKGKSQ